MKEFQVLDCREGAGVPFACYDQVAGVVCLKGVKSESVLDDRQITHLICVCLKHLLKDFLGGVLGLLPVVFLIYKALNTPQKSHIAHVLGGRRLDE